VGKWDILVEKKAPPAKAARGRIREAKQESQIATLAARGCKGCTLNNASLRHPKMLPTGPADADVYILGEAPGADEDEQGEQFVGKAGRTLRRALPSQWDGRIRLNNTIRCRPPGNREPSALEVACCKRLQVEDIERTKPKLLLAVGGVPTEWLVGSSIKITAWRGRFMPVQVGKHKCWAAPMYHPSYVNYSGNQSNGEAIRHVFEHDFDVAAAKLPTLPEPHVEDPADKDVGVHCLTTLGAVLDALADVAMWPDYAIDIETKGLRPYGKDARILSVAVSNYECTYSWLVEHREAAWDPRALKKIKDGLADLLLQNQQQVIAHNSKFEIEWLLHCYGFAVAFEVDWQDTMAQAYVLDEREGAKALEALSLLHLGMDVKQLSKVDAANLDQEPAADVLSYNAYDAKYEYLLYHVLAQQLEQEGLADVYARHNARASVIAVAQSLGLHVDQALATALEKDFADKAKEADAAILADPDVAAYVAKHGKFNHDSSKDMVGLFYRTLHFKECVVGENKYSTDESVLAQIKHPVAELVLRSRQVKKLHGTYTVPLVATSKKTVIWPDGKVHTNLNHNRTGTGRLSSDDPNLQNLPVRTEEGKRIRGVFAAPSGHWFVSFDYGQIEFRVIGMASRDKVLCDSCWDGYDVHGEWAEKIAYVWPAVVGGKRYLKDKAALKKFRTSIKNGWTFPLFYGSAQKSVEDNLQVPRGKLARLYNEFWDMFGGVHGWQDKTVKFYHRNAYVETLTRRRRHGPLKYNEIINTPIQGTASDIVVDASVDLADLAYSTERDHLYWRLNVHDELDFLLPDNALEESIDTIGRLMVSRHETYSFVNVPLIVEVKVGHSWSTQEEVAVFTSKDYGHTR
jgi:uracil-DNA glycosylase family 4